MEFIFAVLLAGFIHNDLSNQIDALEEHTAASLENITYEIIELDVNMTAVHQELNEINKWQNENDATNMNLAASTASNKALIEMHKGEVREMQIQLDSLKQGLKNLRDYVTE